MQDAFWGILIPFLGTSLGAGCVFFLKKSLSDGIQRALTGFAAGVMVAASVWSLLIPAMEQAADLGRLAFFPAAVGFWLGILFLLLLDHLIPHLHQNSLQAEGPKSQLQRTTMMVLAVTLHNIPEGMAVGVVYAGYLAGTAQITAAGALALSLGIAIQNFPEGAIISMPLRAEGEGKLRPGNHEINDVSLGKRHQTGDVAILQGDVFAFLRGPAVAGSTVDFLGFSASGDLPRQSVFASAGPDDEHAHVLSLQNIFC